MGRAHAPGTGKSRHDGLRHVMLERDAAAPRRQTRGVVAARTRPSMGDNEVVCDRTQANSLICRDNFAHADLLVARLPRRPRGRAKPPD